MNDHQLFSLEEIVAHARTHSPYYRQLYLDIPQSGWKLCDLPIIDSADFWRANVTKGDNTVVTDFGSGGIIFKSGGTTGVPKHSVFGRNEWATMCHALGIHMQYAGLQDGDRAANLFYGGSLYASFLFVYHALMDAPVKAVQYPLSGGADPELMIETIREFDINVLLGVPTTLLQLIDHIEQQEIEGIHLERLFYAGETMYPDQRQRIEQCFPGIRIASCGLASVDAGFLAYADMECGFNEHRIMDSHTCIEIVDEQTGEPILEQDRQGLIVATNLTRKRMPIIRYPIGDYGMWREPEHAANRKFVLLGRSEAGARVGPATVYVSDIARILESFAQEVRVDNFQLIIRHDHGLDRLILRLCVPYLPHDGEQLGRLIIKKLLKEREMLAQLFEDGLINPLQVEWADDSQLIINPRTGKCLRVVDQRIQPGGDTHP